MQNTNTAGTLDWSFVTGICKMSKLSLKDSAALFIDKYGGQLNEFFAYCLDNHKIFEDMCMNLSTSLTISQNCCKICQWISTILKS